MAGGGAGFATTEYKMALFKNTTGQKIAVFAWDTVNDTEKTGDAANITAQISKDGGATAPSNDVNPAELDAVDAPGVYLFDLTQEETNCDLLILFAVSSTANIKLEPVIIYTDASVQAVITDTEDLQIQIGAAGAGLTAVVWNAAWDAEVQGEVTNALNAYDPPTDTEMNAALAALNDPTVAAIADSVWNEGSAGHVDAGKAGEQLWTDVDAVLVDTEITIPGLIAAIPGGGASAEDVWAYVTRTLTQSAASVVVAVSGSTIAVIEYTTWSISLTGLGSLAGRTALYFTVKDSRSQTDDQAFAQVEETIGLVRIDGEEPESADSARLVVDDEIVGNITITVDVDVTGILLASGEYDVKMITVTGPPAQQKTSGNFSSSRIVTRAIT